MTLKEHINAIGATVTVKQIEAAVEWLLECDADEDEVNDASNYDIIKYVVKHYEGGWAGFVSENN